jgi:formylmethanofuran dehydrogenase subunit E
MLTVAEYVAKASGEGPPRSGFILGIRMCVLAMKFPEIDDPSEYHRKLIAIVETDRCLPDVMEFMLGCRLGNRTLKFRDWGKMAASFLDLTSGRAVRVSARELMEADDLGKFQSHEREEALSEAYVSLPDQKLFDWQPILVKLAPEDVPGYHAGRLLCERCHEGIGFHREVQTGSLTVCRACAGEAYWLPRMPFKDSHARQPDG